MRNLVTYWYRPSIHPVLYALFPLTWLFTGGVWLRRSLYRLGLCKVKRMPVPVIVVGNVTVGGTGKTPMVIWLADFLKAHGFEVGIVSRGVGGIKHKLPYAVQETDAPHQVGDEALLLKRKTNRPLVIGSDRVKACAFLLKHYPCNIIISDDGLQHYALARDIEIVMVDAKRQFGNRQLLPVGPLREKVSRIKQADFVVENGGQSRYHMKMVLQHFVSLTSGEILKTLPQQKWHALAGIGHPERFFTLLREQGLDILPHVFPDHHLYKSDDLNFKEKYPLVMTEKDAVKCRTFADQMYWFASVDTKLSVAFQEDLLAKIKNLEMSYEVNVQNVLKLSRHL